MDSAKVVIIGAGASGIAAATKLLELGFQNVVLVEAENRIGGRIHTIPFGKNVFDLGAQWCLGEKDNVVFELASKQDLLETSGDIYYDFEYVRSNKMVVPTKVRQRLLGIADEILVTRKEDILNHEGSLGSYFTSKFFEALKRPENSDIDMKIAKEFFENYEKMECSVEASDTLDEVSARGFAEYRDCEGDQTWTWKDKGYHEFLRLLMKSTEKGNELGVLDQRVILGKPVRQIIWSLDAQPVRVKFEDDEVMEADHVIITVSLGVLKEKYQSLFEPKLMPEKVRAIKGIGFGTINKIIMEFPTRFWPSDWHGCTFLWRDEDIAEIRNTDRAWLEGICGFFVVSHQPRILLGWAVGVHGRHMETLPKDEILSGCMYLLRKFLTFYIPSPVNFKSTAWSRNEHFRGSYSFPSVEADELKTNHGKLASPLKNSDDKPVVLFAGEATYEHHYGVVDGAVETGWREAQRLAKFYESNQ